VLSKAAHSKLHSHLPRLTSEQASAAGKLGAAKRWGR
jgi:hypothetical protein